MRGERRLRPTTWSSSPVPRVKAEPAGLGEELPYFAFLIVTAVALYYAKWPVPFIAASVIVFQGWLCRRHSIFYLGTDPFRRVASAAVK